VIELLAVMPIRSTAEGWTTVLSAWGRNKNKGPKRVQDRNEYRRASSL